MGHTPCAKILQVIHAAPGKEGDSRRECGGVQPCPHKRWLVRKLTTSSATLCLSQHRRVKIRRYGYFGGLLGRSVDLLL
ncbi:unnamed protein product [Ectocarpus sp. 13 AM-2016]